ncbi:hypothetical protein HYO65_gp233 [Tenacibaculum phage PTm1]|uniref:Uncharacterized protein n=2 Tax=Shirahamavirus PTm1 TaxID=2846435 RepID=A0A5S9BZG8_9CAUD|nr:hypothetical protein HYO65_gp233 [Tenacibaculum phage PTm1]BBI90625.1 hypothetical protein [Tenacibaculum phage PTm1]BBI90931.1 hypothetical protein [Tenacibaculum phage PTm5]
MARNKNKLSSDLKSVFKDAQKQATAKSFDPNIVNENDSMEVVISKVSEATANTFADVLSNKLATIIDDYITSQDFDVSGLSAPNGPVSGVIKSK